MRSDSQPKTMKNGVPISSADADQRVGDEVVELERDLQEEQRVELAGVPDHALAGGGAEQREQHVLVVGVAQEALGQRRLEPRPSAFIRRKTGDSLSFSRM